MRRFQQPRLQVRQNQSGPVWWAEWWEYQRQPDGAERRIHRSQVIGDAREMGITEARAKAAGLASRQPQTYHATWTVRRWVEEIWLPGKLRRWSLHTKRNSLSMLKVHILPTFGGMIPQDVKRFHVEAWLGAMFNAGAGKELLEKGRALLRAIFDDLEENELVARNPARRAELPEAPPSERTQPYTEDEARRLHSLPGIDGLMLRVLLMTGCRPGELLALRADDLKNGLLVIDESTDKAGHYKQTKTRRARAVSLPPGLRAELEALAAGLPAGGVLFTAVSTVESLRRRLKGVVGEIVRDFDLRRCRATAANLIDLSEVDRRDLLGHTDVEMTRSHYLVGNRERQAAAMAEYERRMGGRVETSRTQ